MPLLRLTQLCLYPLKSAGGIRPSAWEIDQFGLRYDRRWMVVNRQGRLMSQRTNPRLALVRPTLDDSTLRLDAPGHSPLTLPIAPGGQPTVPVTVWGDTCLALGLGQGPSDWISNVLGSPGELVYMPDATVRPADPAYAPAGTRVSFADGFPFLLTSEESLADLNSRLPQPLPMNRFRPNLVIAGGESYIEDTLDRFDIGGIGFRAVKPCGRCVGTTTDQETAERGVEPLRTLAKYRRVGGEVMFGQNVVHFGTGRLTVGASVLV
jgi:uncharacterized protein YcbX